MLPDEYGCAVANRFGELLDDDADPFDVLIEAETEKDKKKKKKKLEDVKNRQKKPGQKESQRDRRVPVRVETPEPAQGNVRHITFRLLDMRKQISLSAQPQMFPTSRTIHLKVHYVTVLVGGTPLTSPCPTPVRLDFSCASLRLIYVQFYFSGISPEEKRGGRGAWNWGSVDEATRPTHQYTAIVTALQEEGEMVVHVAVEMSLDEWKALQESNRPKAEFNIRKTESTIPSKAKVIHESKHLEALENMDEEGTFLRRAANDITSMLDINFGSLGRPSRGGRGRGVPRGAGIFQMERMKPILEGDHLAPNPYDPVDFPALSARQ
uniref:Hyaluronan/mRNA-binding protein domain-containing protein n=1 Tax=Periophthalmus magnuspinnatus TaxID=409849 RepID=A0A3B4AVJ2_9GOBI